MRERLDSLNHKTIKRAAAGILIAGAITGIGLVANETKEGSGVNTAAIDTSNMTSNDGPNLLGTITPPNVGEAGLADSKLNSQQ